MESLQQSEERSSVCEGKDFAKQMFTHHYHFQGLSSAIETECDFVEGYITVVQSVYCYFMKFYNLET